MRRREGSMGSKVVQAMSIRKSTQYIYDQEDVLKALGFNLGKKFWGSIHCDGINRVTVEIHERKP